MKKILYGLLMCFLVIGLIGCNNAKKEQKKPNTALKVGEEFIFKKDGKDYYSLKINQVKTSNDFEYKDDFPESNRKQIIEVDYTYKNISKDDENKLLIYGGDLKVIDSTGAIAENSNMFPKQKPQKTPVGASCTVQAYYGLPNKSDKVKINFTSITLQQSVEYEISVKQ